jgi:hypothetical protein
MVQVLSRPQHGLTSVIKWVPVRPTWQDACFSLTIFSKPIFAWVRGRLHVRIRVRIGVRFGAKAGLESNLGWVFSEMCLLTVVMGV